MRALIFGFAFVAAIVVGPGIVLAQDAQPLEAREAPGEVPQSAAEDAVTAAADRATDVTAAAAETAVEAVEGAAVAANEAAKDVAQDAGRVAESVEDEGLSLRDELYARLEDTRVELEELMKETQTATGLTDTQIFGISIGLVAGAAVADIFGGSGLVTLSLAAGGAALGSYIGGEIDENTAVRRVD